MRGKMNPFHVENYDLSYDHPDFYKWISDLFQQERKFLSGIAFFFSGTLVLSINLYGSKTLFSPRLLFFSWVLILLSVLLVALTTWFHFKQEKIYKHLSNYDYASRKISKELKTGITSYVKVNRDVLDGEKIKSLIECFHLEDPEWLKKLEEFLLSQEKSDFIQTCKYKLEKVKELLNLIDEFSKYVEKKPKRNSCLLVISILFFLSGLILFTGFVITDFSQDGQLGERIIVHSQANQNVSKK